MDINEKATLTRLAQNIRDIADRVEYSTEELNSQTLRNMGTQLDGYAMLLKTHATEASMRETKEIARRNEGY